MFSIQLGRRLGLLLFIIGIISMSSTKTAENTEWLSVLLFFIGTFLYILPDKTELK